MTVQAPLPARRALLIGCAIAGLAAMPWRAQLAAQAFNANPKTVAGVVAYDRATPKVETVRIESDTAIIDWTPTAGTFLPFGNTATFVNGPNNPAFVVLNRIISPTPVRFDGRVVSLLVDAANGTSGPGGTVIFSSPGGILLGPTAVFDVGSLVLTSLNVVDDGAGNFYDPAAQGLSFAQAGGAPPAAVITLPGAQINAPAESSFVAIVSPQILHGGAISVNGSAAFIAGQRVQMRVNQGLFDIIVDTGTPNNIPLVHTGSTGGPASTGAADVHRIYLVAMPVNQAITAVLQGNIGFAPAVNAAVENGAIILSAGFNVAGGEVDRYGDFGPGPVPGAGASFEIRGGNVTSDLFGYAVTDMLASGQATGSLTFSQDVQLFAGRRAHLFAGPSQSVTVAGFALVSAAQSRSADPNVYDFTGGEALIFAQAGGNLFIGGNAVMDADGTGRVDVVGSRAGNGSGGTAGLFADGGTVTVGGAVTVRASGAGGQLDFAPDQGGTGTGGTASVEGRNGGSVAVGTLTMAAHGTGTRQSGNIPGQGAPGTGGTMTIAATGGGSVVVGGVTNLSGSGLGGDVVGGAGNVAGTGTGANVNITAGGTISFGGPLSIDLNAIGGIGPIGGAANGGNVNIAATSGQIQLPGETVISANALGGAATGGGAGGNATGGNVSLTARTGTQASTISGGTITVEARAQGGTGGNGAAGQPSGRGGDARGGNIRMLAESGNGTVLLGAVTANANGNAGAGGNIDLPNQGGRGGDGFGGDIQFGTVAGGSGGAPSGGATFASVNASANGIGGNGGLGSGGGGNGNGGRTSLVATNVTTRITGDTLLAANGAGGAGGQTPPGGGAAGAGGLGDGGVINLSAATGGTLLAGDVTGTASATGAPGTGNSPGEWHVRATEAGTVTLTSLTLTAAADGTPAVRPFSSLEPLNGTINVALDAMLTTPGEIRVTGSGAGRVTGGNYTLGAGEDINVTHTGLAAGAFTIDVANLTATAGDDFTLAAGAATRTGNQTDIRVADLVTVAGRMLGRFILLGSSDIDLTGELGSAQTQEVTLLAGAVTPPAPGQFAVLGGTAQGPGYTLTNAEAGRIRAATLNIELPATGGTGPDLIVRDLSFNGSGAANGIGVLNIVTPGIARVEGALAITNANAATGLNVNATRRLEVVIPAGSIRVRDAAGAPGGTMALFSNNLWIAPAAVIDRLRADPNYPGRDVDLLINTGAVEPRGYIEADGIVLGTGGTLFVQNSGQPFNPGYAGVTVGAGGLEVREPDNAALATVTAFGRRLNADGSFVIAIPFFNQVDFQTAAIPLAADYTAGSTFNLCIIVTGQCAPSAPLQPQGPDPITGPVGGSDAIQLPGMAESDELVDTSFSSDPLIEEPVTSGSEASLWECDHDRDGDCDDQDD